MENEIVKAENYQVEKVNKETLMKWLALVGNKLEKEEQEQFLEIAQACNLNPFKREIYCTAYGKGEFRQLSIITGYEVYLKRAELSGVLDGFEVKTAGSVKNNDLKATCTIHRKDRKFPFIWEVPYSEYVQMKDGKPNKFWLKAETMIKKVAMSQAFRICFSAQLGGLPYTADEMPSNEIENAEIIHEQKQTSETKKEPAKKQLSEKAQKLIELKQLAIDNSVIDFDDFAKFSGFAKGMPERDIILDNYLENETAYLLRIDQYLDSKDQESTDKKIDLPF